MLFPFRFLPVLSLLGAASATAATLTVTNANDSGAGSLRAAIAAGAAAGDTIEFNVPLPATITVASPLAVNNKSLRIRGPGAALLTISGNNAVRVFLVSPGQTRRVQISGLTIANGTSPLGGGVYLTNAGNLLLQGCVLSGNTATTSGAGTGTGGGVCADAGTRLALVDCTLSNNVANFGGAVSTTDISGNGAELTLARCVFSGNSGNFAASVNVTAASTLNASSCRFTGNTSSRGGDLISSGSAFVQGSSFDTLTVTGATAGGGAILNAGQLTLQDVVLRANVLTGSGGAGAALNNSSSGTASLLRCTVADNVSTGGLGLGGGAVVNAGTMELTACTLSGNSIGIGFGGAISNTGPLALANCTLSGNSAGASGGGGAIYNANPGALRLNACTVAFNSCPIPQGGGGLANAGSATAILRSTIVARNTSGSTNADADISGACTSQGFNLVGIPNFPNGFSNPTFADQVGTTNAPLDPLLAPLADNGGPTLTHALQSGSPAIEQGGPGVGVTTDQRGFPRATLLSDVLSVTGSDVGAFESGNTALRVSSVSRAPDGTVALQGVGLPNAQYTVQTAPSMTAGFLPLAPVYSDASGNLQFVDPDASSFAERFYRFARP